MPAVAGQNGEHGGAIRGVAIGINYVHGDDNGVWHGGWNIVPEVDRRAGSVDLMCRFCLTRREGCSLSDVGDRSRERVEVVGHVVA